MIWEVKKPHTNKTKAEQKQGRNWRIIRKVTKTPWLAAGSLGSEVLSKKVFIPQASTLVCFSVLFKLAIQPTYSMSGVVWNFTCYWPHTCNCQYNKMMIKQELFLTYQKLKSSNKHGLNFFWLSVHILHLIENKAILLTDGTLLKKLINFKTFATDLQTLLPLLVLCFLLQTFCFVCIAARPPPSQDSILNRKTITDVTWKKTRKRIWDLYGLRGVLL